MPNVHVGELPPTALAMVEVMSKPTLVGQPETVATVCHHAGPLLNAIPAAMPDESHMVAGGAVNFSAPLASRTRSVPSGSFATVPFCTGTPKPSFATFFAASAV